MRFKWIFAGVGSGLGIAHAPPGLRVTAYDAIRGPDAATKLDRLISSGPFDVHVARVFDLDQIADAHRMLEAHFVGKLVLRPNGPAAPSRSA